MSKVWWVVIAVVVIIVVLLVGGEVVKRQNSPHNQLNDSDNETKPTVTANFVDPIKIAAITKFRSCQGHIVVPQDGTETRSNMKHYLYLKKEFTSARRLVELYAPFDGFVSDIYKGDEDFSDRNPASRDLTVSKSKGLRARSDWGFSFLHIEPRDGLKEGDAVKAGELLGYVSLELIPPYYAFDVVYAKMGTFPKKIDKWNSPYAALDSAFAHMDSQTLAKYATLGADSADDFAIAKTTRDAAPCQYGPDGRQFNQERDQDWYNDWLGNINDAIS
ncbi:MAG: hypothetical protein AAB563_02080 [Patescibacteria group bacterium]